MSYFIFVVYVVFVFVGPKAQISGPIEPKFYTRPGIKAQFLTTQQVGAPGLPSLLAQGAKAESTASKLVAKPEWLAIWSTMQATTFFLLFLFLPSLMQPCRSCLPQMTLPRTKLHTQLPFQPGSSLPCTCSRDLLQKSCMQTRPTAPSQASSCYLLSDSRETRLQQSTAGSFLALGMARQGSHLTNQLTSSLHDCSPCRCDQEHVIFNLGADLPAITPSPCKPAPSSPLLLR